MGQGSESADPGTALLRRAVAAGYHIGARATTGHYWAVVRGTEPPAPPPQAGAAPRQPPPAPQAPGFRRANDAEVADAMRTFADAGVGLLCAAVAQRDGGEPPATKL